MKTLGKFLLTLASLAYPLLWYYGRENGAFFWLAAAMCVLWLIRAAMPQTTAQRITAMILAAFFAAVLVFRRPDSMYWYPVAVNALMLAVFSGSLFAKQTVIERLARLQHPDLPPEGVLHTRRVTQIWCTFFIFNAQPPPFWQACNITIGGGLYRHCVVCVNGNLICRRVDLNDIRRLCRCGGAV